MKRYKVIANAIRPDKRHRWEQGEEFDWDGDEFWVKFSLDTGAIVEVVKPAVVQTGSTSFTPPKPAVEDAS